MIIVIKRTKTPSQITKVPGQADAFKVGVKGPFFNGIICQGIKDLFRYLFSLRKVNDMNISTIDGIAE